jgi:anti-sigma factor ChrR (cupin superfamily)
MDHSPERIRERAAEHALGLLDDEEAAWMEEHLAEGCDACAREVRVASEILATLASSAPPVDPSPEVRGRVLAALAPSTEAIRPGILLVRPDAMPWRPTGIPGIQCKVLSKDDARGYRTSLLRMEPGAVLPPHRHMALEEVFMLDGDFSVEGRGFGPGDYCRSEAGTVHQAGTTRGGCTFMAIACVRDEMLSAEAVTG